MTQVHLEPSNQPYPPQLERLEVSVRPTKLVFDEAAFHFQLAMRFERQGDFKQAFQHLKTYFDINKIAQPDLAGLTAEIHRQQQLVRQFEQQANTDPLTGLQNRRALESILKNRNSQPLLVIMFDLDHFKTINDTYGHAVGDQVLQTIAQLMKHTFRHQDQLVRYGGDEFIVVLDQNRQPEKFAERFQASVAKHNWSLIAPGLSLSISLGVALQCEGETQAQTLTRCDQAMYNAKRAGRNRVAKT
jgi:two-component system, cell cycle response regulator